MKDISASGTTGVSLGSFFIQLGTRIDDGLASTANRFAIAATVLLAYAVYELAPDLEQAFEACSGSVYRVRNMHSSLSFSPD